MLVELAGCHELMARWYRKANSKRAALRRPITLTRAALEPQLKLTCDAFGPALGYATDGWNGKDRPEAMGLSVTAGAWDRHATSNVVVLDLPRVAPETASFFAAENLVRAVDIVVRAWDPERALLIGHNFRDRTQPKSGAGHIGWITYLREERLQRVAGTPPCEMIPLDHGALFVLTRDHIVSADNPEDIDRCRAMFDYLGIPHAPMDATR
jgi:hypothetical protein